MHFSACFRLQNKNITWKMNEVSLFLSLSPSLFCFFAQNIFPKMIGLPNTLSKRDLTHPRMFITEYIVTVITVHVCCSCLLFVFVSLTDMTRNYLLLFLFYNSRCWWEVVYCLSWCCSIQKRKFLLITQDTWIPWCRTSLFPSGVRAGSNYRGEPKASGRPTARLRLAPVSRPTQ